MSIEYVPDYDDNGVDLGGYTETVPDLPEQDEPDEDRPEPCGESGCICYGVGEEHTDCACGCDCPRCWDCMQGTDNCTCDD